MFNVVKGWPTGLGGATDENIEPTSAVLATVTFEGAALAVENGAWALADWTDITLAKQSTGPAADKQNVYTVVYALDKLLVNGLGEPAFDVAFAGKLPVLSGDFIAEFDDVLCPTLPAVCQFVTVHDTIDGKLRIAPAASDVPILAVCLARYANQDGLAVARCRFFTPKYMTVAA